MTDVALTQPLIVGRFGGAYGIKGWVKLFSHTEPAENILSYKGLWIQTGSDWKQLDVASAKAHGQGFIIKVNGYDDRDKAAELTSRDVAIEKGQLPSLDENKDGYYWADLVGMTVVNTEEETLGVVESLMETGANDVMVLNTNDGNERLVPFVSNEIVKSVDVNDQRMIVEWPSDF